MRDVRQALRINPHEIFTNFCDALSKEPVVKAVLDAIKGTLKELEEKESSEPLGTKEFQKLRDLLDSLNSAFESASSPEFELATINCFKDQIQQYIEKRLRSGDEASQVRNNMEKLCRVDLVVPTILWTWTMQEVDKTDEKLVAEQIKVVAKPIEHRDDLTPSLFSKDTLYHASLCCEAINVSSTAPDPLSFFRNKKPQHKLTEVSFSQNRDGITRYLIAKQGGVLYVAFQSTSPVSEWIKTAPSFDEGLKQQCSQVPLRFFMDELLKNRRIVLTGFSFGGMLACCVGAQLWHNTAADREVLLQRVICITFGRPFLKIKMVEEEINICPEFEQSIHSVFNKEDVVPLMCSYLCTDEGKLPNVPSPPTYPKTNALVGTSDDATVPRATKQTESKLGGGLFNIPFVKGFLQNLAILQDHSSQKTKKKTAAVEWLQRALRSLALYKDQTTGILYGNCYVMSRDKKKGITWRNETKQLAAIELSQRTKLVADQLNDMLYQEHNMESYIPLIFRSHMEKPKKYALPNRRQADVEEVDVLKPKVTRLQIHEFPGEKVFVLQGENLWFSYKIILDDKGPHECELYTPVENTTQFMIEFRGDSAGVPAIDENKQVKVALYTHFANPIRQPLNAILEPHDFSVRQMQLAKHTPSEVIQLAFLCALLEQRDQKSDSKRFKAIAHFLEQTVKVVPIESVFGAIAYKGYDIALDCAKALKESKLQLQPSPIMLMGALRASIRAHTGHDGSVIDRYIIPSVKSVQQAFMAAKWWLYSIQQQGFANPMPLHPQQVITTQFVVRSDVQPKIQRKLAAPQAQTLHHNPQHSSVAKVSHQKPPKQSSEAVPAGVSSTPPGSLSLQQQFTFHFPIFLDHSQFPQPTPFPVHIMKYLDKCLKVMLEQMPSIEFCTEMCVVSKVNISEIYSVSPPVPGAHFKSPLKVLSEGLKNISTLTDAVDTSHMSAKLPNERMLSLIETAFKRDAAVCASLLGAFMEQQIHIPLINTAKNTAEMLSSQAAPVAVGVWALFSQNLSTLLAKLESTNCSTLNVEIREYIEGIRQQLPANENRMYAGKLQFMLQGIKEVVTAGSQYISYSLEHQLCNNEKFKRHKSSSLKRLITQWDKIFKGDALSLIAESHRPLVARWLKWTILVHDLREALAQYTCIGVTGLVNSGKSLLVKKLFDIEKVKVGTRSAKRTTVPLLYNLEDSIDGLDVIDFPGVDDSDHTVPELAELLLSLAQIVVFVVDYKRARSESVKQWLQALTRNGVPIHICLTHADELYSECAQDGNLDGIAKELMHIKNHLKLDTHHSREITFYSFDHISDISSEELKTYGINSPIDVGNWLVQILKTRFQQNELAKKLQEFLQDFVA